MKHIYIALGLALVLIGVVAAQDNLPTMTTIQRLLDEGETNAALDLLEQRINGDSKDVQARFMKATLLLERGDKADARDTYADIVRRFPKIPEASNNLAAIYAEDGEYEKARQALLGAIANVPEYSLAHANLGDLYVKMALNAYRQALSRDPDNIAAKSKLEFLEKVFEPGG